MDLIAARHQLKSDFARAASRRGRLQREVTALGLEMGALAHVLREEFGVSRAESARSAGVSPALLTELMKAAAAAGVQVRGRERIPALDAAQDIKEFVGRHNGLRRIIADYAQWPIMYLAGLDPAAFQDADGLHFPWLVGQCGDGEWFGFSDQHYSVGYNGGGPSSTIHALKMLGLDDDLAQQIAFARRADVDLDAPEESWAFDYPHDPTIVPPTSVKPRGPVYVAIIDTRQEYGQDRAADADLREWLQFLDQKTAPGWMCGPRHVRAWLDADAANGAGYGTRAVSYSEARHGISVVVEQGRLQLWLDVPISEDPTMQYSPEMRQVVELLGFYGDMASARAEESRSKFVRWIRSLGIQRPPYVDHGGTPRYLFERTSARETAMREN